MTVIKAAVVDKASPANGSKPAGSDYIARLGSLDFVAGRELRRFVAVPEGATWCEMSFSAGAFDTPK